MLSIFWSDCSCRRCEGTCENVGFLVFYSVSLRVSPCKPSSSLVSSQGTAQNELNVALSTQYCTIIVECCAITSHSLQGTWQTRVLKPSRCSSWVTTLCRCCAHLRSSCLGDSSRRNLRFTGAVCSFTSHARHESDPAPWSRPPAQSGLWVSVSVSPTPALVNSQPGWQS